MTTTNTTRMLMIGMLAMITFVACKKEDSDGGSEEVGEVFYDADVKTIMSNNCTSCHAGSSPSAGLDLTSKDNVQNAIENRNLLGRINSSSNPMPQSGLMPQSNRDKMQAWKDQGFN